jgi:hypothetical protein
MASSFRAEVKMEAVGSPKKAAKFLPGYTVTYSRKDNSSG